MKRLVLDALEYCGLLTVHGASVGVSLVVLALSDAIAVDADVGGLDVRASGIIVVCTCQYRSF